jgi:hypothetical protein
LNAIAGRQTEKKKNFYKVSKLIDSSEVVEDTTSLPKTPQQLP